MHVSGLTAVSTKHRQLYNEAPKMDAFSAVIQSGVLASPQMEGGSGFTWVMLPVQDLVLEFTGEANALADSS